MKKKVTLSIDSNVYNQFREFCDKNAIMLSKRIELIIKSIMEEAKKEKRGQNEKN